MTDLPESNESAEPTLSEDQRLRRWRLILGGDEADGTGYSLEDADLGMDQALAALYDGKGGLGRGRTSSRRGGSGGFGVAGGRPGERRVVYSARRRARSEARSAFSAAR